MRIAIIHPFFYRYARGIERFTANLANALTRCGVEVDVLTWRWQDPIQIDSLDPRVRIRTFRTGRYYAAKVAIPYYVWQLLASKYDFVWIFFAGYGEGEALTLVGRQSFGIVFHYPYIQVPHRYREFARYGLPQRAAQIVSVSEYVAEGVREAFGRDSTVIHHGVNSKLFQPNRERRREIRRQLSIDPESLVLLTAAAMEERKGIQWVMRALPEVVNKVPQTVYLVLGDDDGYQKQLEKLTRELGVEQNVRFLGSRSDIALYYQATDIALILARGEASSLFALEALACEVPVIASHQPPFDELIEPGYGLLVDEHDSHAVAEKIVGLGSDVHLRQVMGSAGRLKISSDFTWERIGQQYLSLMQT